MRGEALCMCLNGVCVFENVCAGWLGSLPWEGDLN